MENIENNNQSPATSEVEVSTSVSPEALPNGKSEAQSATSTPHAEGADSTVVGTKALEGDAPPPAAVIPPYAPNFKFKSYGKELEFDEFIRGAIKDAETEEKVRKLYAKAYALPQVMTDRDQYKEKFQEKEQYINQATNFLQKKDYRSFFEYVGLPEEELLNYAYERAKYRELEPGQQAKIDEQYQSQRRAYELEQQNQALLQNYESLAEQQRRSELFMETSKPEVAEIAESFNERMGDPQAFMNAVIEQGQLHWFKTRDPRTGQGQDLSVQEAVKKVMALIGGVPQSPSTQAPVAPTQPINQQFATPNQGVVPQQAKPIIPNIRGNGTSPVKKSPNSIEDLKRIRASLG